MDQYKFKTLLDTVDEKDRIKLTVLHNANLTGIKNYRDEPTSTHLNNWQRAEKALDDFVNFLWSRHVQQEETFPNILAVVAYLTDQGWKISKSAAYNHQKKGLLRPHPDGLFYVADVERYAKTLERKDGSKPESIDKIQQKKLYAETRKSVAQAEHWETKTRIFTGEFVPRGFFEHELAKRALVFRSDLNGFIRSEAAGIIHIVDGDSGKVSDLIAYLLVKIDEFLGRYTEEKEFTIPPPASSKNDLAADDGDEEEIDD